jgi:hypothetical protein
VCLCRKFMCLRSMSMLFVPAATVRGESGELLGEPGPGSFSEDGLLIRFGYAMSALKDLGVPPISASSLRMTFTAVIRRHTFGSAPSLLHSRHPFRWRERSKCSEWPQLCCGCYFVCRSNRLPWHALWFWLDSDVFR